MPPRLPDRICRLGVCTGPYPKKLLDEWDRFAATKRSENDRPGTARRDQAKGPGARRR